MLGRMPSPQPGLIALLQHRWARTVLEALGVIAAFWLIGRLHEVLTPLLIGLVLAYTLDPVVSWLGRHGLRRSFAVTLVFGSCALVMAAALLYGVPKAWKEGRLLYEEAVIGDAWDGDKDGVWVAGEKLTRDLNGDGVGEEAYIRRLRRVLIAHGLMNPQPAAVDRVGPADVAALDALDFDPVSYARERMLALAEEYHKGDHHIVDQALAIMRRIGFYLTALALIPVYAYFFSLQLPYVSRTIIEHIPLRHRPRTLRILSEINQAVGAFFRGRVLICAILAVIACAGLASARVPSWLVLGLLMGGLSAVPLAPLLMVIPAACLLYLSSADTWQYWVLAITYVAVQGIEHLLILIIMGKGVEIHPVIIIVAILSFGALLGVPGVILAVPLAATARILAREFLYPQLRRMAELDPPGPSNPPVP